MDPWRILIPHAAHPHYRFWELLPFAAMEFVGILGVVLLLAGVALLMKKVGLF